MSSAKLSMPFIAKTRPSFMVFTSLRGTRASCRSLFVRGFSRATWRASAASPPALSRPVRIERTSATVVGSPARSRAVRAEDTTALGGGRDVRRERRAGAADAPLCGARECDG